jgi:energy-coupling factor transporter ATP-binding protein EcfA2
MPTAYTILESIRTPLHEKDFTFLVQRFQMEYLKERNYEQQLLLHRDPDLVKCAILTELYRDLLEIQDRDEMKDFCPETKIFGCVPTIIADIWKADKRLKTLFDAIEIYCRERTKDVSVIATHLAEYRALNKLVNRVSMQLNRKVQHRKSEDKVLTKKSVYHQTPEKLVLPIHFEDRSGLDFERLVFAFLNRLKRWDSLEWLGQTGDDGGRDIWGVNEGITYCYQCANYRQLSFQKVKLDIDKLLLKGNIPNCFTVVCGGRSGAKLRVRIQNYALSAGIQRTEVWSGAELEEKLREHAPTILKRFVLGEAFPEEAEERLLKFVDHNSAIKFYCDVIASTYVKSATHFVPFSCIVNQMEITSDDLRGIIITKGGLVITGKSGCGKSELAKNISLAFLEEGVPIFLEAKFYETTLQDLIDKNVQSFGFESAVSFFKSCQNIDKVVLLILDGINECTESKIVRIVEELKVVNSMYKIKCLVTTQQTNEAINSIGFPVALVSDPDIEVKKSIARLYCSAEMLIRLEPILNVVSTGLEAKMIGEIGVVPIRTSSRFELFELFIRRKLVGCDGNVLLLLSQIAQWMSANISFSISLRTIEKILSENKIPPENLKLCYNSGFLIQNLSRAAFSHEMFMSFFVAENIIRVSPGNGKTIIKELKAPKNADKRLLIIGGLENHRTLQDVLESMFDVCLLVQLADGAGGEYAKVWVDKKIDAVIAKIESEVESIKFEIISDEYHPVRIVPITLCGWNDQEKCLIHTIPFLLQQEQLCKKIFSLVTRMDATCTKAFEELQQQAKQQKVSLRTNLFLSAYVKWIQPCSALSWILSNLQSGLSFHESRWEIRQEMFSDLIPKDGIKHGQFYFLLLLCRYRDSAKYLYHVILNALREKWGHMPSHLRSELLNCVGHCYSTEDQRIALIEQLNAIHGNTRNPFESTSVFDALSSLGALEEDALAYMDTVRTQIRDLLSDPDTSTNGSAAAGIFYAQFDHPYDYAFSEAISELDRDTKSLFFIIALKGESTSLFTSSLIVEAVNHCGLECAPYLVKWTAGPLLNVPMPQESLSVYFLVHILLGKFDYPLAFNPEENVDNPHSALIACSQIYYWLNRTDLTPNQRKENCKKPARALFVTNLEMAVECIWQSQHVIFNGPVSRLKDITVISLEHFFSDYIAEACRFAIKKPDRQKGLFSFDRTEEIVRHAFWMLERYGNISDIEMLKCLSNDPAYGENAVRAIKKLQGFQ